MSAANNPWSALSGMIQKKVGEARQRKQQMEDQERQNQMNIIMAGVQARATSGTLTDDDIKTAQESMQKLVPKESIPIVEGWHKVMGLISRKKQQAKQQAGTQADPQKPQPAQPSQPQPAGTNSGGPTPVQAAPGAPQANSAQRSTFPSATELGTASGQQQSAQDAVLRQSRQSAAEGLKKSYQQQGKQLPSEVEAALDAWAVGAPANVLFKHRVHPVVVKGPNNTRVPAIQNEDTGEVIGPDGNVIQNPEVVPTSGGKPRVGWGKDKQGFFSVAIDPYTNQPIPGTEDRTALPPAAYMDKIRVGQYFYTDDSGGVHEIPNVTKTGVAAPTTGSATVPPAMKTPGAAKGAGASTGTGKGAGASSGAATVPPAIAGRDRTLVGSKDTGVLSPQAIKVIDTTQPVLDQVDRLLGDIDRLNLGDNNTSGYLFKSRLGYSMGHASPEGSLANDIAGLSLGSVVEAASALQGSSRSIQALKKALVHTPNAWVDSPKLIREKLQTIKDRLTDVVNDANQYGRKRQVSTAGPSSRAATVPANMRTPAKAKPLTPDQEAEQYLAAHP